MGLLNFFVQDLGIDLGTANTIIIYNDEIVVEEPSIIAIDVVTGKVIAIGIQAMQMHGKTHEKVKTIRPLKDRC
jgi:rod shape-determining protein MreB and related proteins